MPAEPKRSQSWLVPRQLFETSQRERERGKDVIVYRQLRCPRRDCSKFLTCEPLPPLFAALASLATDAETHKQALEQDTDRGGRKN